MSVVKKLRHDYGDFKLDISDWEIDDQGITALWGPSGAGKTSVFRAMIGLDEINEMSWVFDGVDLSQLSISERKLGVVFQTLELFPHMTAQENIMFAAIARQIDSAACDKRFTVLRERLLLDSFLNRSVKFLSGGESQRVAIARALMGFPRFLFLDEPFSSLDEELRKEARKVVKETVLELNTPTLLITHDERDIESMTTKVVRIEGGRLV